MSGPGNRRGTTGDRPGCTGDRLRPAAAVLWLLPAVLCLLPASAASLHQPVSDIDPASHVSIFVESAFERVPSCGYAPLRLVIRNDSPARHVWDFTFSSASPYGGNAAFRSGTSVDCDAKAERIVEIMVPISVQQAAGYSYPQLTTRVSGYGCGSSAMQIWSGGYSAYGGHGRTTAYAAMSDTLGVSSWVMLENLVRTNGVDLAGTQFDPAKAPGDWRGWSGCDSVWLADTDWEKLDKIRRQALLDWTRLGGSLHVCFPGGDIRAALPDLPQGDDAIGLGRFDRITAKDPARFVDYVDRTIRAEPRLLDAIHSGYSSGWGLRTGIPPIVVHTGLILLFVCLFAVLIGPVNLFALARKQKHMHLFWTTPALSILASIALALVIVLQDGFGGKGNRFNAVFLDSAAHRAFVVQEQVSRCGVLLSRRVPLRDALFMTALNTGAGFENRGRGYALENDALTGDWFSSRTIDGHLLFAVQPSRARVEISDAGGTPVITSGIGATLTDVFYRDQRQDLWHAQNLKTGERKKMQKAANPDFLNWQEKHRLATGRYLQVRLAPLWKNDDYFFASAEGTTEQVIPTLPSIVWKQNALVYFGPVMATGGAP